MLKIKKIRIALAGNPNCGKTTLFNLLTGSRQHVGNWSGVTVEKKEGFFTFKDYEIELIDLPGIYSLSPNSIEEIISRNFIIHEKPDLVLNVIDGTSLERSLLLTTQLIETGVDIVLVINMFDEVQKKGMQIDTKYMETLLSFPVRTISASKEEGISDLIESIINRLDNPIPEKVHIPYGDDIEKAVKDLECSLNCADLPESRTQPRWTALRLLSGDSEVIKMISVDTEWQVIYEKLQKHKRDLNGFYGPDLESVIMERQFGFINGIIKECFIQKKFDFSRIDVTEAIDSVLLNKYLSFPIFGLILWLTFQLTFLFGGIFSGFLDHAVHWLGHWTSIVMPQGMLKDLLLDGIISGVGGILVFLPQILILFLIIAILEDSGYMARAAFIMDKFMHFLGLHGKSFISLFMGIGCNVPGIMAARTLENEEDRKVTVLINPFMSCSARLPIYLLIAGMFFGKNAGTVIFVLYILGIIVAVLTAKFLKTVFFKKKSPPFVMELPPYRTPTLKSLLIHMWERASQFLKKMGGVILVGSIIIWALGYFPMTTTYSSSVIDLQKRLMVSEQTNEKKELNIEIVRQKKMEQMTNSMIGRIGKAVEPVFKPLGLSWREGVALITGVVGKEIVVSTISVLYGTSDQDPGTLKQKMRANGLTPLSAFGFLLFVLLYLPCLATIAAVRKETNSVRWMLFSIIYGIGVAYLLTFAIHSLGMLVIS